MLAGWTVDAFGVATPEVLPHTALADPGIGAVSCLVILLLLAVGSLLRQGPRGMMDQIMAPVRLSRPL